MFLSREIDIKFCVKIIPKRAYVRFCIIVVVSDHIQQLRNESEIDDIS